MESNMSFSYEEISIILSAFWITTIFSMILSSYEMSKTVVCMMISFLSNEIREMEWRSE